MRFPEPSRLSRAIALRLLGALLVALAVAAATAGWLIERSDRAARVHQLEDAIAHVRVRVADLETSWQVVASQVRAQLDFSRILDDPSTRGDRLTALLASFSGTLVFSQVFLADSAGRPVYRYHTGSGQPMAPPPTRTGASWLYSGDDQTVYRVLSLPVVTPDEKGLQLVVLVPVDRAVLLGSAYPGADVYLAWRGRVVTGSTPEPVGGSEAALLAGSWHQPAAAVPWGDDPDAPHLVVRRTFDPPTDWREALAALAVAGILLALLGWLAIGMWLSRIRNRVEALKAAADLFRGGDTGNEAAIAKHVATARAADGRDDGLSDLAGGFAAMMRERQQAEEALRQSEARLREAQRIARLGSWELDLRTNRLAWSDEVFRMFEVDPQRFEASHDIFMRTVHPEDRAAVDLAYRDSVENRTPYEIVIRLLMPDGRVKHVREQGETRYEGGRPVVSIGTVQDMSELRRAQQEVEALNTRLEHRVEERTRELASALDTLRHAQQEIVRSEKLAALGSLVAGVAHELNTPIGNCMTVATTLQDRSAEFEKAAASGTVRRSALQGLIEQLRDGTGILVRSLQRAAHLVASFKQVAVDQSSEQRRPFDLLTSLDEIREMLMPMIRVRACRLDLDVPPGIALDSFPGPLAQVITNLVTNAITHGFEGRPGGCMTLAARLLDPERVELLFSDDGRGIAPEHLGRIFDPFFTTRLGQGGSGLGLHIVYNLTTGILGGTIDAESRPGTGARFRIALPLTAPRTPEPAAEAMEA